MAWRAPSSTPSSQWTQGTLPALAWTSVASQKIQEPPHLSQQSYWISLPGLGVRGCELSPVSPMQELTSLPLSHHRAEEAGGHLCWGWRGGHTQWDAPYGSGEPRGVSWGNGAHSKLLLA